LKRFSGQNPPDAGAEEKMTSSKSPRTLSEDDARVLDQLAENGFDSANIESLDAQDRPRGEAINNLFSLLERYPVEDASDELIDATLARVNRAEEERSDRMNFGVAAANTGQLSGRRWRFPDLFATAALILIAVGVIWPVSNSLRKSRAVAQDHDNLVENHAGMSTYASENNGATPMQAAASLLPDPFEWMGGHAGQHNAKIREACGSYARPDDFHQPGGDPSSDAYSFQVWSPGDDLLASNRVIASNANPLPALQGAPSPLTASEAVQNSRSHSGRGQNVLYGDGRVDLLETSEVDGDRIWDPGSTDGGQIIQIIRGGDRGEDLIFLIQ